MNHRRLTAVALSGLETLCGHDRVGRLYDPNNVVHINTTFVRGRSLELTLAGHRWHETISSGNSEPIASSMNVATAHALSAAPLTGFLPLTPLHLLGKPRRMVLDENSLVHALQPSTALPTGEEVRCRFIAVQRSSFVE